jgi:hypothetical protein
MSVLDDLDGIRAGLNRIAEEKDRLLRGAVAGAEAPVLRKLRTILFEQGSSQLIGAAGDVQIDTVKDLASLLMARGRQGDVLPTLRLEGYATADERGLLSDPEDLITDRQNHISALLYRSGYIGPVVPVGAPQNRICAPTGFGRDYLMRRVDILHLAAPE